LAQPRADTLAGMDGQRLRKYAVVIALLVVIAGLWFLPRATSLGAPRQPEPIELRSPSEDPATMSPSPTASPPPLPTTSPPAPDAVDDQSNSDDDGADDGNRRRSQPEDDDREDDAGDDDDADDDDG
jgi:hypothetical protein